MANTLLITCTACKKQLKVPKKAEGKKIRCKNCQAVIPVPMEITEPKNIDEEAIFGKKPYEVTETNLANRCPFCANDIDPPDAVICLFCGYDLVRRGRREQEFVHERTAADFIMWHLPTLGAFLGIVAVVLGCWYYHYKLPYTVLSQKWADEIMKDRWGYFENDQAEIAAGLMFHWGVQVWGIVIGLFVIWKCGYFIFKRLFYNFLPPEIIKRVHK